MLADMTPPLSRSLPPRAVLVERVRLSRIREFPEIKMPDGKEARAIKRLAIDPVRFGKIRPWRGDCFRNARDPYGYSVGNPFISLFKSVTARNHPCSEAA